jgi:ATP-dependent DNA helicase RecG
MCETNNSARERLAGFAGTEDGFEIAEMDMRDRGAGNLEGSEQSGAWVFRWFDWIEDQNLIQKMLDLSEEILDNKPDFDLSVREKIQTWYSELPEGNEDGIH